MIGIRVFKLFSPYICSRKKKVKVKNLNPELLYDCSMNDPGSSSHEGLTFLGHIECMMFIIC